MGSKTTGYLFTLLAIFIFGVQDGISRHLGELYPPIFVAMIRYWAFAAFAILLASRSQGGLRMAIRTRRPVLQVLRGVLLVSQIVLVITSFRFVGLAHSQAILSSTPLFVALLSMPLLGERVGWRRWTAICVGLVGVLIILKPTTGGFDMMVLLPLVGAVLFAVYVIATRLVSRTDTSIISFLYIGVVGSVAATLVGPFFWTSLAPADWGWMLLLCATGMCSHYFLIRAYDLLDAAAVQPLTYLQLILSLSIGALVFGESISLAMIIGSIIVVGAGIFTIWRESVVARRQTASVRSTHEA